MTDINIKEQQNLTSEQIELKMCANPAYLPVVRTIVRKVNQVIGFEDKDDLVTLAGVHWTTQTLPATSWPDSFSTYQSAIWTTVTAQRLR